MTKLDRMLEMEKTAKAPNWLRNVGTGLLAAGGIYGAMRTGSSLGKDLASIAHGGKVGLGSETRWKQDHKNKMRSLIDPALMAEAKRSDLFAQGAGLLGGGLVTSFMSKNPLVLLGGALTGRGIGKLVARLRSPTLSALEMGPASSSLGETIGLLPKAKRAAWQTLLNSRGVANDPKLKAQFAAYYNRVAKNRPVYKSYAKKKKIGRIAGGIAGVGLAAALMAYGSRKGLYRSNPDPTSFQKAIGGNSYWPWAGLAAAGLSLGVAKKVIGGRRARLTKDEIKKNVIEEVLTTGGAGLSSYGGGPV